MDSHFGADGRRQPLTLDGSHREAGDEAIEEHREHDRDRYGDCQKNTSPRTSSVGTPVLTPFCELGEMKARA